MYVTDLRELRYKFFRAKIDNQLLLTRHATVVIYIQQ